MRRRAGLFDLSSFGKIDLQGPGALPLLQRTVGNDLDRPVGSVTYTQFLNARGGIVGDVMIARLAETHFRVVTGSGVVDADLGWLRFHRQPADPAVEIRDVTDDFAVIGMWGPNARKVLQAVTADDVSPEGFPYMTAKPIAIGGIPVLAQRATYVGELGWEFYIPVSTAVFVWDRLWAAGREHQMASCGYKAIDALRLEKGFLAFATDITGQDNPYEARLGFCVKTAKEDFIGKAALLKAKAGGITRRLCTLTVGDAEYLTLYGGEAVYREGNVVGRLRSAGYGYTVEKNIAYAYLPLELSREGTPLDVEIFGERVSARVARDRLYDPAGKAIGG